MTQDVNARQVTHSPASLGQGPSEPLVPIRLSLLTRLREYQGALEKHIFAYMNVYQVQRVCDRARTRIEKGLRELHRLGDAYYWESLRELLQDAERNIPYPAPRELPQSLLSQTLEALLEHHQKAAEAANDALSAPAGTSMEDALRLVKRHVEQMLVAAESALKQTRSGAEEALAGIKMCSERILERAVDQTQIPRQSTAARIVAVETRFRPSLLLPRQRTDRNRARPLPDPPARRIDAPSDSNPNP
ncbi:MAG: hypothetical protein H5U10_01780 [Desulfacinum sp.]|jgi:hypothetical protein|nr:hypothetical protein [Desulfacinum sp.]MBZ4659288.1 hypothetical protein [Desulfacinum sp.]